jgi:hypothetical protein
MLIVPQFGCVICKLTSIKPTREMLPAISPATTATNPSTVFQAIVKYSSRRP